ncbi:MAG: hypothetical protein IPG66_15535 [Hydrogenophilales bacterium]|nr:hypothetical protein [Hydrogenophilales bacterium]
MDFPAHVPAAVRAHITTLIEGDSWEPMGWAESLASAERQLAEIEGQIESCIRWGKDDYLPGLRKDRAGAVAHRDGLAAEVDCLRRLAHDARMADAFALLTREFTDDRQWRNFTYAAWAARVDFAKYRDRLKRAAELKGEIADAAETLAKLIRQFSETGISGPGEFYSIPELLRQTDNHEMQGHNLHMWRSMRQHVLGDLPKRDAPETKPAGGEPMPPVEIVIVPMGEKAEIDPEEEARNMLRYAWGTAPDFSALLGTMANAARSFKPSESGMIGAAIESRQRSAKTEYLRAFGNLLTDVHGFALTTPIMQAMAIVANVVINLPDVDVTYDDVRKALAKLGGARMENSGEK